jgi:type II secretory pathway predicted ATPase ExeA
MYESYFGFQEKPFSLLPDPGFLYLGRKHSMALAMLQYGVRSQAGFTVIAGEIGSGKTTLIRHLLDQIPYEEVPQEKIALPDRVFNPDYEREPLPPELFVPQRY